MAVVHYTARVKDSRTLELPEEAQVLRLQAGAEVQIFVDQNEDVLSSVEDAAQEERFQALAAQLFAEADAIERQPGTYTDLQYGRGDLLRS